MKRNKLWIWIVCLVLLIGCIAAVLLLRQPKLDGAEQVLPTMDSIAKEEESSEDADIAAEKAEPLPADAAQPEADEKQLDVAVPDTAGRETGPAAIELPEIEIPDTMPDTGKDEPQENTPAPKTDDPQPDWSDSDIIIYENGDILLPEVP